MERWETPYMNRLAEIATQKGGKVLEVGFGLAISATAIQGQDISEHVIIEANADVFKSLEEWAKKQPHKVTPMFGLWQDVVKTLPNDSFDGILYDTYPNSKEEQHTHQFGFIKEAHRILKPGGVLTYCNLTSIGVLRPKYKDWESFFRETQLPHLKECGFVESDVKSVEGFPVTPPAECEYYDFPEALAPTLFKSGEHGYHGLRAGAKAEEWKEIKADLTADSLKIEGHPVMERWETPYMNRLAEIATQKGGKVLEVGFGLAISATAIQGQDISEHVIIEANADVFKSLEEWAKKQPHKVTPMFGLWQDVVKTLPNDSFDGILYDTYPNSKEEQHTHQFGFIKEAHRILKPGGVLTYCNLTSIGVLRPKYKDWESFFRETQLPHLKECGFVESDVKSVEGFPVTPPAECEYYDFPEALAPTLFKSGVASGSSGAKAISSSSTAAASSDIASASTAPGAASSAPVAEPRQRKRDKCAIS